MSHIRLSRFKPASAVALTVLAGAISLSACTSGGGAIVQTFADAIHRPAVTSTPQLNPNFDYIRVLANGRTAFLAKDPIPGDLETWYSGDLEVFRMKNGRLVGASGTTTEWRRVAMPALPSWGELAKKRSYHWRRSRDVMPGYLFGIEEDIEGGVVDAPSRTNLVDLDPSGLTWFDEHITSETPMPLPPARYAVDLASGHVVYAEQCLASDFCLSWQRWSPQSASASIGK